MSLLTARRPSPARHRAEPADDVMLVDVRAAHQEAGKLRCPICWELYDRAADPYHVDGCRDAQRL